MPKKEPFYVLPQDKVWARARIAQLEQEIEALGPEFEDALTQSSESWHDNAPFDALRDRQALLAAERHSLKKMINITAVSLPKPKLGKVGVGSRVVVNEAGKKRTYFIAGHWSPHTGNIVDGALVVTCGSPVAGVLMGKQRGQSVKFGDPGREIEIVNIAWE